jgi:hypothetical protein
LFVAPAGRLRQYGPGQSESAPSTGDGRRSLIDDADDTPTV